MKIANEELETSFSCFQLLANAKLVKILPYLHELPLLKTKEHHGGDTDMLSCGGYVLPCPLMGTGQNQPHSYEIIFSHHSFYSKL